VAARLVSAGDAVTIGVVVVAMGKSGAVAARVPSEFMVAATTRTSIPMAWSVGADQH
jgi:hypothetical protein